MLFLSAILWPKPFCDNSWLHLLNFWHYNTVKSCNLFFFKQQEQNNPLNLHFCCLWFVLWLYTVSLVCLLLVSSPKAFWRKKKSSHHKTRTYFMCISLITANDVSVKGAEKYQTNWKSNLGFFFFYLSVITWHPCHCQPAGMYSLS